MAELIFGPLVTKWPKPQTAERDRVRAPWLSDAEQRLTTELQRLGVREARVELDADPADFRKDGRLYKDAKLKSPRVLVLFTLAEVGEVMYACDQFNGWRQNLNAIGMTLERLRLIDGYGATVAGARQQYRGFKRLGSGGEAPTQEQVLTPMDAAALVVARAMPSGTSGELLRNIAALVLADAEQMRLYVRKAERATHPDVVGGPDATGAAFAAVQRAKAVLQTHHAGAEEAANV